jgi:hypothetical protein
MVGLISLPTHARPPKRGHRHIYDVEPMGCAEAAVGAIAPTARASASLFEAVRKR